MKNKKKISKEIPSAKTGKVVQSVVPSKSFVWQGWLVFLVGIVIYANTLFHDFTQDDAIVIYDNMFTTQGVKGIPGLFKYDTFYGFFKEEGKANLVSGGRYRPLTPAMFAIEYSLVGKNPFLGHFLNIILYGFLCFFIYKTLLLLLLPKYGGENVMHLSFIAALLYALHPLHTEVVANIKGRDEIVSMLASMMALYAVVKGFDLQKKSYLIASSVFMFLGLLSKENTITFVAVIPLALYFFRDVSLMKAIISSAWTWAGVFLFLLIRSSVLGLDMGGTPMELMNNPFIKLVGETYVPFSGGEKLATILFILGKYLALLVFPHPLTHDYYPRHIDIMTFNSPYVWISLVIYIGLIYAAWKGFKDKKLYSFAILYFIATTSIISNIIFPIGTNMSERFMFMPSLGFTVLVAYWLVEYLLPKISLHGIFVVVTVVGMLFAGKTFTRNMVWKNDYTLFTTDVHTSKRSAKVLNAAGGALTVEAQEQKDPATKKRMNEEAVKYLEEAIAVHPTYKNAYLIRGNALFYLERFDEAIRSYEKCVALSPDFQEAYKNMAVALREAGKVAGEKQGNLIKAEGYLQRSLELAPDDSETVRLLGVAYGVQGKHDMALQQFLKVSQMTPNSAQAFVNLYHAYKNMGNTAMSEQSLQKALALDPNILKQQQR
ncbi:MAG: tetratricopeptide repeat protein [Saprospiraceae bacterium]